MDEHFVGQVRWDDAVPRFYFHLLAGAERVEDETGLEFPNVVEAMEKAARAISELRAEDPELSNGFTGIEVRDEENKLVLKVPLGKNPID